MWRVAYQAAEVGFPVGGGWAVEMGFFVGCG
jgi:hypothetical protein